jgi:hypothetical protein
MAGGGHNKPTNTTHSSDEKKVAVGPTASPPKEPKAVTKAPNFPAANPKQQPYAKTLAVSASIEEMTKPKPQVDLVMNRTP